MKNKFGITINLEYFLRKKVDEIKPSFIITTS